jgi:hypothetical protein
MTENENYSIGLHDKFCNSYRAKNYGYDILPPSMATFTKALTVRTSSPGPVSTAALTEKVIDPATKDIPGDTSSPTEVSTATATKKGWVPEY